MGYLILSYTSDLSQIRQAKVVGVFRYPSKKEPTCSGVCKTPQDKKESGWIRNKRGRYVHKCGKPHTAWRVLLMRRIRDSLGDNLLSPHRTPKAFQTGESP